MRSNFLALVGLALLGSTNSNNNNTPTPNEDILNKKKDIKPPLPKGCKEFICSTHLTDGRYIEKTIIAINTKSASKKFQKYLKTL